MLFLETFVPITCVCVCVSWAAMSNVFLTMDHEAKKSLKTPAGSYVSYFSCSKICVSDLLSEYIQFKFKVLKYLLVKMFFIDLLIKQVYDTHHPACYCIQDTVTLSGWHSAVIQLCVCTCTYTYEELIIRFSLKTIFSVCWVALVVWMRSKILHESIL